MFSSEGSYQFSLFPGDIEIVLKGRGDKTVNPRSFTPGPRVSSVSPPAPVTTKDKFRLGSVLVTSNKEELSFQPGLQAFRPENYRVTDFSHQTTPQGHTYR